MTTKINSDTSDGLKITSDTSGILDIQSAGTTKMTVGTTIDIQGNELVLDADADTSIHASTDDQIDFKTGGTDRFEINASGNVEVLNGNFTIDKSSSPNLLFNVNGTEKGYVRQNANDLESNSASGNVLFRTGGTERVRIDSNGTVTVKQYLFLDREGHTFNRADGTLRVAGENGVTATSTFDCDATSNFPQIYFANPNGTVGSITTNGSATAFNTSSDYRLKENVNYSFTATDTLKQLKPCEFNWKTDDTNTKLHGFIAHELKELVPESVSGDKDELDKDGNIEPQGVDQSKLVPLLVKTIQELEARITALESE